jgi:hypothetical protein
MSRLEIPHSPRLTEVCMTIIIACMKSDSISVWSHMSKFFNNNVVEAESEEAAIYWHKLGEDCLTHYNNICESLNRGEI